MRYFAGILLGVVCLFQTVAAKESVPKENWKYGSIVLNNGQKLEGPLAFDLESNVVVLRLGKQMQAFSAYAVKSFMAIDTDGFTQSFFTLPYAENWQRSRPMFFQLIFDGQFTLFAREKNIDASTASSHRYPTRLHPHEEGRVLANEYFVFFPNGKFKKLRTGRKNLTELLSLNRKEAKQISHYIIDQNIDFSSQPDIIRLIDYCVNRKSIAIR